MDVPSNLLPQLPEPVREIITSTPEAEYASVSSAGTPVGNPLFHYYGADGSIDIATGVAYPAKANRARRNPRVGLLFAPGVAAHDPVVKGTLAGQIGTVADAAIDTESDQPVVVVAAVATVRDSDIQANTDRYVRDFLREHPLRVPWEEDRVRVWYYARIYVECRPSKVLWWPNGIKVGSAPEIWAAEGLSIPPTTVVDGGRGRQWPTAEWQEVGKRVLERIPAPTLTVRDDDGFPLPFPTLGATMTDTGFWLDLPTTLPWQAAGSACLTFAVSGTFLGTVAMKDDGAHFTVDRVVGNLPLAGNEILPGSAESAKTQLLDRLTSELEKLGQPMPEVRITPGDDATYPVVPRWSQ